MKISGIRVETLMAQRGMTKTALAKKSGVSRANISTVVRRGTCEPRTVGKIATGLGVPVEEILEVREHG